MPAHRRALIVGAWLLAILLIGFGVEQTNLYSAARERLQARVVAEGAFGSAAMRRALTRLGLASLGPAGDSRFEYAAALGRELRQSSDADHHVHLFTVDRPPPEALPSTTLVSDYWVDKRLPLLSIAIDQYDLRQPTHGLRSSPTSRGRDWERPGYLSYFDDGQLRFASGVGIRIHGGKSRRLPKKSFRVYFRDIYGADQFAPGVLLDAASTPLRRLIVHNDYRQDYFKRVWQFANPLAFDITRRIGGLAPQTQPVSLFLNGSPVGVYVLTERL